MCEVHVYECDSVIGSIMETLSVGLHETLHEKITFTHLNVD